MAVDRSTWGSGVVVDRGEHGVMAGMPGKIPLGQLHAFCWASSGG